MSYMIRSRYDSRSILALPAYPGGAVRWVDPIEGIAPWTFATQEGAERARDTCADCGEVVPAPRCGGSYAPEACEPGCECSVLKSRLLTRVGSVVKSGYDNVKVSNTPSAQHRAECDCSEFYMGKCTWPACLRLAR